MGPYHVRCWKIRGKVHKEYVKPAALHHVITACEAYRNERKRKREVGNACINFLANHRFLWRMILRLDKGKKIAPDHAEHIVRIHKEGCHAQGRPPLRKRRVMDPFIANLRIECFEKGLSFAPVLMALRLGVPLHEVEGGLEVTYNPIREREQKNAVFAAFNRQLYAQIWPNAQPNTGA
jgi:hypothetical protein